MRKMKTGLVSLLLLGSLSLTGCSSVHSFLNPPKFTPPATTVFSPTAFPAYVQPGTVIAKINVHDRVPASLSFTVRSTGFTAKLSCPANSETQVKGSILTQGATRNFISHCSSNPTTILTLNFPEASDDRGQLVKLTVGLSQKQPSAATLTVESGSGS